MLVSLLTDKHSQQAFLILPLSIYMAVAVAISSELLA